MSQKTSSLRICMVRDGDRVLLWIKKRTGQALLPGGHVEVGESLREAVIREVKNKTV